MEFISQSKTIQIIFLFLILLLARHLIRLYLVVLIKSAVAKGSHEAKDAQKKRVDTLVRIVGALLTGALGLIGFVSLLFIFKVDIMGLLAGLGAAGVVLGLIGQSLIKDLLAGFFILIENQYRVGDVVTLGPVSGVVEDISIRITRLRDFSGNMHIVPNGAVEIVTNQTFGWSNINLDIGVAYESDLAQVEKVVNSVGEELAKDENWAMYIIEPVIFLRVERFDDSAVIIKAHGRVEAGQQWPVAGEFRARLKKAFEKNSITIPYPQQVVHNTDLDKKLSK